MPGPTYKLLAKTLHDDVDLTYWAKIRALYAGGPGVRAALRNPHVRSVLFPMHLGEEQFIYDERVKRAYLIPYMTYLIDRLVSALGTDPVRMSEDSSDDTAQAEEPDEDSLLSGKVDGDPFYDAFWKNCARPDAPRQSFNQLLKCELLNALLCRRSWTLVDLPKVDPNAVITSRKDEEDLDLDKPYACHVDPENVLDWECDENGELLWVNVANVQCTRPSVLAGRSFMRETYTVYTREDWTRFIWEWDSETQECPDEEAPPTRIEKGPHSFGRVPLVCFELPEGLWAGGKLEGLATQHFNQESALAWSMYRSLFQFLVVQLASPDPLNPVSEDPKRALNQVIGPGRIMQLAAEDKAAFLGPQAGPYEVAMKKQDQVRDEMFRIMDQLAAASDNSAGSKKQSGDSKQADQISLVIVLRELGRRMREHAEDIYEMVAAGRGEKNKQFTAQGADQFDVVSMDSLVTEAVALETVQIPSKTFKTLYKFELARNALPGATEAQLDAIMNELKDGISAEDDLNTSMQQNQLAAQDVQADRIEQGQMPGEALPSTATPAKDEPDGGPPKGKAKKAPPARGKKGKAVE